MGGRQSICDKIKIKSIVFIMLRSEQVAVDEQVLVRMMLGYLEHRG